MRCAQERRALVAAGIAVFTLGCSAGAGDSVIPQSHAVQVLDVQAQVFTPHCALSGCHTGAGAPFGLDLSSAQLAAANLVGVSSGEAPTFRRVAPFTSADSYIYMKLTADPRIHGDPMPLTGGPLGAADLNLVKTWIDQGAQ